MSTHMNIHTTAAPVAAAGVSCVMGFDLHEVLGYVGQIIGILSGIVSVSWVVYQGYRAYKAGK
jgi:hypothetical protein